MSGPLLASAESIKLQLLRTYMADSFSVFRGGQVCCPGCKFLLGKATAFDEVVLSKKSVSYTCFDSRYYVNDNKPALNVLDWMLQT